MRGNKEMEVETSSPHHIHSGVSNLRLSPKSKRYFDRAQCGSESLLADLKFDSSDSREERKRKLALVESFIQALDKQEIKRQKAQFPRKKNACTGRSPSGLESCKLLYTTLEEEPNNDE